MCGLVTHSVDTLMVRYASILLVSLGLIFQPVMATMPAQLAEEIPHTGMLMDADISDHTNMHGDSTQNSTGSVEMPCHEEVLSEVSEALCDCGDSGCLNGVLCVTTCSVHLVAIQSDAKMPTVAQYSVPRVMLSEAPDHEPSFIIFHPPKYS
jgi:hypothetical protein